MDCKEKRRSVAADPKNDDAVEAIDMDGALMCVRAECDTEAEGGRPPSMDVVSNN